jgi:hypothetical protein
MVQKAARSSNLSFEGNNAENKMSLDEEICEIKLTQQNIYTDRNDNRVTD